MLRNPRTRGGDVPATTSGPVKYVREAEWATCPEGRFWSEGTQVGYEGFLFGEIPLPAGQTRKWHWMEPIWIVGWVAFYMGAYCIWAYKPREAYHIRFWANPRARAELQTEMKMMDKLNKRPDLHTRLVDVAAQLKMIPDEVYDLIYMRNEYKVKLGLFSGRVPAELADIYAELEADDDAPEGLLADAS